MRARNMAIIKPVTGIAELSSPTIKQKADHVRAEIAKGEPGKHHCHWTGCTRLVPAASWGCKPHWYALPQGLRNKIWAAYVPRQEVTKTPSARYIEVAKEVRKWINENSGKIDAK